MGHNFAKTAFTHAQLSISTTAEQNYQTDCGTVVVERQSGITPTKIDAYLLVVNISIKCADQVKLTIVILRYTFRPF